MDWLDTVREDGYGLISAVFGSSDIESLLNALRHEALPRTRAGVRHAMRSPSIAEIANNPRMLDIARKILGPAAIPFRATLFEKLPDSNWLVAWHQDTALPLQERREASGWKSMVNQGWRQLRACSGDGAGKSRRAAATHLDDSNLDNRPLRVCPQHAHDGRSDRR